MKDSELDALVKQAEANKNLPERVKKLLLIQDRLKKPKQKIFSMTNQYYCPLCNSELTRTRVNLGNKGSLDISNILFNTDSHWYYRCTGKDCEYEFSR